MPSAIKAAIVAVLFLAAVLYLTPWLTPIELKMDAVKIDSEGHELGTYTLFIKGSKKDYLFQPSRLDVSVDPIGNIYSIYPSHSVMDFGEIPGMIQTSPLGEYLRVYYGGIQSITNDSVFCSLLFSPDLTRWVFCDDSNSICYVASADGEYTVAELLDYFAPMIP